MNNCRYCGHKLQSHRNGQCHAIASRSQISIMDCHCEDYRGSKGNGETCAVCGAIAQWGLLCKKHYSYNDFTGLRLWREVEKEKKWKKRIMYVDCGKIGSGWILIIGLTCCNYGLTDQNAHLDYLCIYCPLQELVVLDPF